MVGLLLRPRHESGPVDERPHRQTPAKYIEKETGSKEGVYAGPPMWAFLPWEKKWKMVFSPPPYPKVPYAAQMEYVPDLGARS